MYGDFRSMKSATTVSASSSSPALQGAVRLRLELEHGVPRAPAWRAGRTSPPRAPRRGPPARGRTCARGARGRPRAPRSGENSRPCASMSWLRCTTRMASGISSPLASVGKPVPFHRSNVKPQGLAYAGVEAEPGGEHVGHLAPRREVVHRPRRARRSWIDRDDLLALLGGPAGGRERDHVAHHLGRVRGVMHQGLGADGDLVAEQGGDLVRVARAPEVAQQRHPVDRVAQLVGRSRPPRSATRPAGTTAAATRAAARTRCPARAPAWRRAHPSGAMGPTTTRTTTRTTSWARSRDAMISAIRP